MSLVVVFVAIVNRMGFRASPVSFPAKVMARVRAVHSGDEDIFVDVYESSTQALVTIAGLHERLRSMGFPDDQLDRYTEAATTSAMIYRVASNIFHSVDMPVGRANASHLHDIAAAGYAALFTVVQLAPDDRAVLQLARCARRFPLDVAAVLEDGVARVLPEALKLKLRLQCDLLGRDFNMHPRSETRPRHVKYFVGLIIYHKRFDYYGLITGWHVRRGNVNVLRADEASHAVLHQKHGCET